MGRNSIETEEKNKNVSISLPQYQLDWIEENSETFSLSKFVQGELHKYIMETSTLSFLKGGKQNG